MSEENANTATDHPETTTGTSDDISSLATSQEPSDLRPQSALDRARAKTAAMRAAGVQIVRLDPMTKAANHPKSLRLAITAKCYDCSGRDEDPGMRGRVLDCNAPTCPLWPVRPWQRDDSDQEGD